jgi:hypothetical protein
MSRICERLIVLILVASAAFYYAAIDRAGLQHELELQTKLVNMYEKQNKMQTP